MPAARRPTRLCSAPGLLLVAGPGGPALALDDAPGSSWPGAGLSDEAVAHRPRTGGRPRRPAPATDRGTASSPPARSGVHDGSRGERSGRALTYIGHYYQEIFTRTGASIADSVEARPPEPYTLWPPQPPRNEHRAVGGSSQASGAPSGAPRLSRSGRGSPSATNWSETEFMQ